MVLFFLGLLKGMLSYLQIFGCLVCKLLPLFGIQGLYIILNLVFLWQMAFRKVPSTWGLFSVVTSLL